MVDRTQDCFDYIDENYGKRPENIDEASWVPFLVREFNRQTDSGYDIQLMASEYAKYKSKTPPDENTGDGKSAEDAEAEKVKADLFNFLDAHATAVPDGQEPAAWHKTLIEQYNADNGTTFVADEMMKVYEEFCAERLKSADQQ